MAFPSDLEIAQGATLRPLTEIAENAGIPLDNLEPYGSGAAKIQLEAIPKMADRPDAKYVVVSAITPTPLGEGKTTTTVGLGQAFHIVDWFHNAESTMLAPLPSSTQTNSHKEGEPWRFRPTSKSRKGPRFAR